MAHGVESRLYRSGEAIVLQGALTRDTVPALYRALLDENVLGCRVVDAGRVTAADSAGVALTESVRLRIARGRGREHEHEVPVLGAPGFLSSALDMYAADSEGGPPPRRTRLLSRTTQTLSGVLRLVREYLQLSADVFTWAAVGLVRRVKRRRGAFVEQCLRIGVDSVVIIGLLSFIIGLILALQSAAQLRQFGANIFVANLLGIAVVREMAPMMTAILVAGRSGSAIASEVATMKVTEELEALTVMGLDPVRYVIVPKLYAITVVMPILVTISMVLSLSGGVVIGMTYLNISPQSFLQQLFSAVAPGETAIALFKSVIFAWQIVIVASFNGFRVKGGAEGVGVVTTAAVVASVFSVIVIDVLFSFLYLT